jgi:nucleotide-binding universal stress UspA family protein
MMPFNKILFPVDFSRSSIDLVADVRTLAQKFSAPVVVLHAFDMVRQYNLAQNPDAPFGPGPGEVPYIHALQELRHVRENRLNEFVRAHFEGIETTAILEDGDPARTIEWIATKEKAGLVMMSTKGQGRFRRMLMGSLTSKVLHDVECPVYTSPHEAGEKLHSPDGFRTILCAVRMRPEPEAALTMTGYFARAFGARVCLLHVHTHGEAKEDEPTGAQVRQAFEKAVEAEGDGTIAARARVLDARFPEGIRQAALEEGADLVVVGRGHSRGTISHLWSHLYTLIRESPCPVLSV